MEVRRNYKEVTGFDVIVCGGGPAGVAAAVAVCCVRTSQLPQNIETII